MSKKSVGNCFLSGPHPPKSSNDQFLHLGERAEDPNLWPRIVDSDGLIALVLL